MYSFIHKSAAGRFFECAVNSAGGERLRREGEILRSRGETSDIILLNESLKGWLTGFFLGLIVFMGCSLACVHACFFKNALFFT